MHALILVTICCSTVLEFAVSLGAPSLLKLVPELLSAVLAVFVLLEGVRGGFSRISLRYWIVFGLAAYVLVSSAIANNVGSGPVINGSRFYLRAIPLFFAAAVVSFNEKQLQQQMKLVLAIGLLQLPVTALQRYVIFSAGRYSGDDVRGTVLDSGILSLFLIGIVLVLIGFYMRRRLTTPRLALLFLILLLPTTINETKVTVLLLPLGLLATIVAGAPRGRRLRMLALGVALTCVFGAILVPVYDFFETNSPWKNERSLVDFFTNPHKIDRYMEHSQPASLADTRDVRREDAYRIPFEYMSRDPIRLILGLGPGSVSDSTLGKGFVGRYHDLLGPFAITSFSTFLMEIGVLGTAAVFLIYWLVLSDSLAVARTDCGVLGAIAVGWIGVTIMMAAGMFYTQTHGYPSVSYLFWYFSGLIAARRTQLAYSARTEALPAPSARAA